MSIHPIVQCYNMPSMFSKCVHECTPFEILFSEHILTFIFHFYTVHQSVFITICVLKQNKQPRKHKDNNWNWSLVVCTHFAYMIIVLYMYRFQRGDIFTPSHAILYHVKNWEDKHVYLPWKKHLTAAQNISLYISGCVISFSLLLFSTLS